MGYLGATLTQVFTRARRANVSLWDVTVAQMENKATEWAWRHASEARGGFGGFWKSQLIELSPASGEDGWLSLARGSLGQVSHERGGRWKSQNRKNMYLSPYVEEPINSKVIKSFVPDLRSRKCFSCFEIPMFYVYILWTFYVRFTHSRIMGMEHFVCLNLLIRFWFVPIPFGDMVKFQFLAQFLWIAFSTQSCLVLYFICSNLLYLLITWFIVSSLSTQNQHLQLFCVLSIFTFDWWRFMVTFHLWRFFFLLLLEEFQFLS